MTIEQLKAESEKHIERRKAALAEIATLTLSEPDEDKILDLAWEAWNALEDAREAREAWKALRDQNRPKCTCGCHQDTPEK